MILRRVTGSSNLFDLREIVLMIVYPAKLGIMMRRAARRLGAKIAALSGSAAKSEPADFGQFQERSAEDEASALRQSRDGYKAAFEALSVEATELRQAADGYKAAFENLSAEASELRRGRDGYKSAFENLDLEASELRRGYDGYRRAYEERCSDLALAQDRRKRVLDSLEKSRDPKRTLPQGLAGRQLCFMHIGKTAGTSLQHALFEAMQGAAIFHESLENFDEASPAEISLNDLVIGHFSYQHVAKLRPDRFLFTFLRDPVERVISNYYFLRSASPVSDYSRRAVEIARETTLSEFLACEDPSVLMVTQNLQAKFIAHDIRPENQAAIRDLRHEAEQNLSRFDFVGIVERFDEGVAILSQMIGLDLTAKRLNVNELRASNPTVSQHDIDSIRRLNAVDLALYDKARGLFEQRLRMTQRGPGHWHGDERARLAGRPSPP